MGKLAFMGKSVLGRFTVSFKSTARTMRSPPYAGTTEHTKVQIIEQVISFVHHVEQEFLLFILGHYVRIKIVEVNRDAHFKLKIFSEFEDDLAIMGNFVVVQYRPIPQGFCCFEFWLV